MEQLTINLVIADRSYKLIIPKEDEVIFRNASRMIGEKMSNYGSNYAYKDKQDLLAMVALQYTVSTLRWEEDQRFKNEDLSNTLTEIDQFLTETLHEKP
jgi:cell division protein ZapA (FtsZ GTPase activity inhibitor)